ncbi:MAG TPA: glycosyltransferase family 2 protein [Nitrospirota bacterium]|nr:glycosyltransferase family 2 protein [Nitrospirota bacterium]
MGKMDLSIIIVNWNSKEYIQKCIESILVWTSDIKYEIVVIDNASLDGVDKMLEQYYPQVRFIQSDKNLGFAKANNIAFKKSSGRNVLFLNPDTEIEESAIGKLCHWLDSLPAAGIVGAKLLNNDRSVQTSCIQAFPTIFNQIFDSNALRRIFPRAGIWGTAPFLSDGNEPSIVDTVSGACLMIKRVVFENVRMFSPEYYMYSEDIDLCFKVKEAGWNTYYIPMAVIIHHGGTSSIQSCENAFSSVMILESRWRFFRKTRSHWYCWFYRIAMFFASMLRIGMVLLVWPFYGLRGRASSVGSVMKKWTARLRWTLGAESWTRNY